MENPSIGKVRASDSEKPLADGLLSATAGAHAAIDEVKGVAKPALERIAGEAHAVVDRLAGAAGSARDRFDHTSGELGEAGSRVTAEWRSYIGAHPIAAVGIAMATGFLLSRLIRSR